MTGQVFTQARKPKASSSSHYLPRFRCTPRLLAVAFASLGLFGVQQAAAGVPTTAAYQVSSSIVRTQTFTLPRRATHIAVHWRGQPNARVRVAFSRNGSRFGGAQLVRLDEVGEQLRNGETYGAIMVALRAKAVRVAADRPLARLTLVALTDRGPSVVSRPVRSLASVAQHTVIPRAAWGADESLRFDLTGKELWPPTFWPIQKLIVHHTAMTNNDPNPAATIRSIYYYHAVTLGWGDIGYNFLIDEAGNVYEGRYSRQYAPGQSPTGQDLNGNGVTGAHAQGYNSGTVGIALLGTLTNQDATPAARGALERLLAWIASTHGIDPQGSSRYTNPVSGLQVTFPNIAGHRDVNTTECPGGSFYATLPTIRADVATLIAATPDFSLVASPSSVNTSPGGSVSYSVSVDSSGGFSGSVSLSVSALPAGATATFTPASIVAPGSSTLSVVTSSSTSPGSYPLTITGTSSSLVHTASVTLIVKPPPDFALSISPGSRNVSRGGSTSYTVSVSSLSGFTGTVTLSVSGLPRGATASFNPSSVTGTGSSTLKVRTTSSTSSGKATLVVTGTSASTSHTATASLTVK